jgi:hypothetical protein
MAVRTEWTSILARLAGQPGPVLVHQPRVEPGRLLVGVHPSVETQHGQTGGSENVFRLGRLLRRSSACDLLRIELIGLGRSRHIEYLSHRGLAALRCGGDVSEAAQFVRCLLVFVPSPLLSVLDLRLFLLDLLFNDVLLGRPEQAVLRH